jgi:hypothetical protein
VVLIRRILLAALSLPLFAAALVLPATAAADTTYDAASLTRVLLTGPEVRKTVGSGSVRVQDEDPGAAPISLVRDDDDGAKFFLNIGLWSANDGSSLGGRMAAQVLNADFIQSSLPAYDSTSDLVALGRPLDGTFLATFNATTNGINVRVTALSFVHNNVWGLILYNALPPQDTDAATVGQIYAAQLPR